MSFTDYIKGAIGLGQLGGGIASLFGGSQDNNQSAVNNAQKSALEGSTAYRFPIQTPGYSFGGGILANRNTDYLDANRRLQQLYGQQLGGLNSFMSGPLTQLRAQIAPGYGQLTNSMVQGVRNAQQQAVGNLRDQLSQRNVAGASFANNQIQQVNADYAQKESEARAQAFQQEMQATLGLNQQQMDVLNSVLASVNAQGNQANQQQQNALAELGLSTSFLKNVNQYTTDAQNSYKQTGLAGAAGGYTATGPAYDNKGNPTGNTGGTGGSGSGAFAAGYPMPGKSDHKWTQIYNQFKATGDLNGYLAYLRQRGAI